MTDTTTDRGALRRAYAAAIGASVGIESAALIEAFATVPRERFLPPGPWHVVESRPAPGGHSYRVTPDADPARVYVYDPIAIDPTRQLNNGAPGALAMWINELDLRAGDRVLHVGCGTGYYTAIMAAVVGPSGRVVATEVVPDLAARARANLADLAHVAVVDDAGVPDGAFDAIFVNAGATHIEPAWLDALAPGGRMMVPLTVAVDGGWGGRGMMLRVARQSAGLGARFTGPVGLYHCERARNDACEARLRDLLDRSGADAIRSLRRDAHAADSSCVLHGSDVCLSSRALDAETSADPPTR